MILSKLAHAIEIDNCIANKKHRLASKAVLNEINRNKVQKDTAKHETLQYYNLSQSTQYSKQIIIIKRDCPKYTHKFRSLKGQSFLYIYV